MARERHQSALFTDTVIIVVVVDFCHYRRFALFVRILRTVSDRLTAEAESELGVT